MLATLLSVPEMVISEPETTALVMTGVLAVIVSVSRVPAGAQALAGPADANDPVARADAIDAWVTTLRADLVHAEDVQVVSDRRVRIRTYAALADAHPRPAHPPVETIGIQAAPELGAAFLCL